jgi:hypothetical protein
MSRHELGLLELNATSASAVAAEQLSCRAATEWCGGIPDVNQR